MALNVNKDITDFKPPLLIVKNLSKTVPSPEGSLTLLSNINLSINAGESVAIMGASGAGKSTLLAMMAGLDLPTQGEVLFNGVNLVSLTEEERARLRKTQLGFVFQAFHLLPTLTALENVALPLTLRGDKSALGQARLLMAQVGLSQRLNHFPRQLSGGEQQRVAIARAYIGKPAVLFADEPTGNLDHNTQGKIIELLFSLNQHQGTALVIVTHDLPLAKHCQRVLHLAMGEWVVA